MTDQLNNHHKPEPKVQVKLGWINESGHFDEYCEKYVLNPWAMNEGLADSEETVMITVEEFQRWFPKNFKYD